MCRRFKVNKGDSRAVGAMVGLTPDDDALFSPDVTPGRTALALKLVGLRLTAFYPVFGMDLYGDSVLNARLETADQKPAFKLHFGSRRALFPASGFYEKDRQGREHYFQSPRGEILYLAGLYDDLDRFVLLTSTPVGDVVGIHPRMVLALDLKEGERYLDLRLGVRKIQALPRAQVVEPDRPRQLTLF